MVYVLVEPSTLYYQVITRSEWMLSLVAELIWAGLPASIRQNVSVPDGGRTPARVSARIPQTAADRCRHEPTTPAVDPRER